MDTGINNLLKLKNINSHWIVIIIFVILVTIWYILSNPKEHFNTHKLIKLQNEQEQEHEHKQKIIQKINSTDGLFKSKYQQKQHPQYLQHLQGSKTSSSSLHNLKEPFEIDNLLGVNSKNTINDYKNKYFSMYAHQISCPGNCGIDKNGMTICSMNKNINSENNIMDNDPQSMNNTFAGVSDTFMLNNIALSNVNNKSCVTCNFKSNSGTGIGSSPYNNLPSDIKTLDEMRLQKMQQSSANSSNYVNFGNNVNLNSIGETEVDKINEIRSCQDAYGTCNLSQYGQTISQVYDKLTTTPAYLTRN